MRAQVHVQPTDTEAPEAGAKQVAEALLERCPRQRPVTLALLAHGPHPGLTPTPWVLDGLLAALVERERTPVNFITLGDSETAEQLLAKARPSAGVASAEMIERPARDRRLSLRMPPHPRPVSVLRELVGSSLIVCAPLCCALTKPGSNRQARGPLAATLAALAALTGFRAESRPRRPSLLTTTTRREDVEARVGHELLGAVFASAAVVLDASWLALVGPSGQASTPRSLGGSPRSLVVRASSASSRPAPVEILAELESPARVLGLPDLGRAELGAVLDFDAWLGQTIGLEVSSPGSAPSFDRAPGRWPRPRVEVAVPRRAAPQRLADRAIAGIRSQSARLRSQAEPAALPRPTPGPLAPLWTDRWYGDQARAQLDGGGLAPSRRQVARR